VRSEPFFADVDGALHGFQWTGHDDFAGNNVLSIALEVPDDLLAGPVIGVWATISLREDNMLVQMARGGNPTINPFINPDGEKDLYNSRQPADDVANYLGPWSQILENSGYPPEEARQAALTVLPDTLRYDRTKPAAYPNGRGPTDDVYSMRFAWLSHGKVPPTGLKPHDDLLNEFPYLGPPTSDAASRLDEKCDLLSPPGGIAEGNHRPVMRAHVVPGPAYRTTRGGISSNHSGVVTRLGVLDIVPTRHALLANWGFLTNHAQLLMYIAQDPGGRLRDIAAWPPLPPPPGSARMPRLRAGSTSRRPFRWWPAPGWR